MVSTSSIPMPPLEVRKWVGPTDEASFDNPSGSPIYADFGIPGKNTRRCSISDADAVESRGNCSSKIPSLDATSEWMLTRN